MSKSKKWRNGKKKRVLSPEEKAQKDALKEKRFEKQRQQKRKDRIDFIKEAIPIVILVLLYVICIIIDIIFDTVFLGILFLSCWLIAIILVDKSGFRRFLFKHLPDKFPFAAFLKADKTSNRRGVEACKTISLLSVWLMLFVPYMPFLWTAVWIISTSIVFIYIIFDNKTNLLRESPVGKGEPTAASGVLLLTSPVLYIFSYWNIMYNNRIMIFTLVFTIAVSVIYLLSAKFYKMTGIIIKELCIFVVSAIAFSFVAFIHINEKFDFKEPIIHYVIVDDMYFYSGKTSDYSIFVKDWNNRTERIRISISSDDYHMIDIGDEVAVSEYSGALGMKYYHYSGKVDP